MKRGLESVEVWMWIVAGLVIGGLIFVSGYSLLSHWVRNNEVGLAQKSYTTLKSSIINVCAIGFDRQEIESFVFPKLVNNISVFNKTTLTYGFGHSLCMHTEDEGEYCEELNIEPNSCYTPVEMDTITFEQETGLFYMVQKALGKSKAAKVRFTITKNKENISIDAKKSFLS